jgi:hypothetical protein
VKVIYHILILSILGLASCGEMDNLSSFSKRKYLKRSPKQKTEKTYFTKQQIYKPNKKELSSYNRDINLLASVNNLEELLSSLEKELVYNLIDSNETINVDSLHPLNYMMEKPYTTYWKHNNFILMFDHYNKNEFENINLNNYEAVEGQFYKALINYKIAKNLDALVEEKINSRTYLSLKQIRDTHLHQARFFEDNFKMFIENTKPEDYYLSFKKTYVVKRRGQRYARVDRNGGKFDPRIDTSFYKQMYRDYFQKYLNKANQIKEIPDTVLDSLNKHYDFAKLENEWQAQLITENAAKNAEKERKSIENKQNKAKKQRIKITWETIGMIIVIALAAVLLGAVLYLFGAITYAAILHLGNYGISGGPSGWINFLTFLSLAWLFIVIGIIIVFSIGLLFPETNIIPKSY